MAETYNFRKLSEVEQLETVPENANAIVEVDGEIKRVAGGGLGGGVLTVTIITDGVESSVCQCDDATYEEVKAALDSYKPVLFSIYHNGYLYYPSYVYLEGAQITIKYPKSSAGIWWSSERLIQGFYVP